MLRPIESSTKRIARFKMRTHAVPIPASTHGNTARATATSAMPIHALPGCALVSKYSCIPRLLRTIADPFAQQTRRPEDQHGDQHEEREHVLVVGAEQRQVRVVDAAPRDRVRPIRKL